MYNANVLLKQIPLGNFGKIAPTIAAAVTPRQSGSEHCTPTITQKRFNVKEPACAVASSISHTCLGPNGDS